jgi:hypothetical protein
MVWLWQVGYARLPQPLVIFNCVVSLFGQIQYHRGGSKTPGKGDNE